MASRECSSNPKNRKIATKRVLRLCSETVYCTMKQRHIQSVMREGKYE